MIKDLISCTLHFGFNYEIPTYRTPYATFVRIVTPIAPEDGRVSPKHVELKELKANKYSIASSW